MLRVDDEWWRDHKNLTVQDFEGFLLKYPHWKDDITELFKEMIIRRAWASGSLVEIAFLLQHGRTMTNKERGWV